MFLAFIATARVRVDNLTIIIKDLDTLFFVRILITRKTLDTRLIAVVICGLTEFRHMLASGEPGVLCFKVIIGFAEFTRRLVVREIVGIVDFAMSDFGDFYASVFDFNADIIRLALFTVVSLRGVVDGTVLDVIVFKTLPSI